MVLAEKVHNYSFAEYSKASVHQIDSLPSVLPKFHPVE